MVVEETHVIMDQQVVVEEEVIPYSTRRGDAVVNIDSDDDETMHEVAVEVETTTSGGDVIEDGTHPMISPDSAGSSPPAIIHPNDLFASLTTAAAAAASHIERTTEQYLKPQD